MDLIFLDTETTGNEVGKDRLCQICYKTKNGLKQGYFKPPLPISVKAMSITHITNKMVADKEPFVASKLYYDLEKLLPDHIMVAHNAVFDKAMLEAEGLVVPHFICTLRVARYLDTKCAIPEYGLQYLRYFLDIDVAGKAHDAETDVKVLMVIFERLQAKMKESMREDEIIPKMIEISQHPSIFTTFSFGKHKGKRIDEVAKTDRDYLEWLLKTKLEENTGNNEDIIYTLQHYLNR